MPTTIRRRWHMPLFCVLFGALLLGAYWLGGDPGSGAGAFGVMTAVGLVFLLGTRSDTLQGIGGGRRDERWAVIDLRATAASGVAVTLVAAAGFLYELSQGRDGSPWIEIGGIAGLAYLVTALFLRLRS